MKDFAFRGSCFKTYDELKKMQSILEVDLNDPTISESGPVLKVKGEKILLDRSDGHKIFVGGTGGGKTTRGIIPELKMIAKSKKSLLVHSPKEDIINITGQCFLDEGYKVKKVSFRSISTSDRFNPLAEIFDLYYNPQNDQQKKNTAYELVSDLAEAFVVNTSKDPFWDEGSRTLLIGLCLALLEFVGEEGKNIYTLENVFRFYRQGIEKFSGDKLYFDEYFSTLSESYPGVDQIKSVINYPGETRSSMFAVFEGNMSFITKLPAILDLTSTSDIDFESFISEPTVIFLVTKDESDGGIKLMNAFVSQLYSWLVNKALDLGGTLPSVVEFVLDEFSLLGEVKGFDKFVAAARSRGVRFTLVVQGKSQLEHIYGRTGTETIMTNMGTVIFFGSRDIEHLKEISVACGTRKTRYSGEEVPLMSINDLQRLNSDHGEVLILVCGVVSTANLPFMTYYGFNTKNKRFEYKGRRKMFKKEKVDLINFVKTQRRKKLYEILGEKKNNE